ncbi:MAG TPA: dihydropteroate synthase [Acetobacteraceae bacterium]|nr:dihydropteroate synthase [Acetobacteraceae bacterium]
MDNSLPPLLMGILNATSDSFASNKRPATIDGGLEMIAHGAAILDIGGESTRPGAEPVPADEERRRVLPLIEGLAGRGAAISIDTRNASTMAAALDAGAEIVNDVSGLTFDEAAASLVAERQCRVVLMHSRGTPQTMQALTRYGDVLGEVIAELLARVAAATRAGVRREQIILDPGFGFAKTAEQSLALLAALDRFVALGFPILVGVSRKSFVGRFSGAPDVRGRLAGSLAAALFAASKGAAILRVHDVAETAEALRMWRVLATGEVAPDCTLDV